MGEAFDISRVGTDGKLDAAIAKVRELDGKVDAIGLGGIDVYLYAGRHRYALRDGLAIARGGEDDARRRRQRPEEYARARGGALHAGRARDRPARHARADGQRARSLRHGASARRRRRRRALRRLHLRARQGHAGSRSCASSKRMAEKYLPDACKLPFQFFYPTGKKQEQPPEPKYPQYYEQAEIIAGDFHFMRQFMPERLDGKIVLTNTVTQAQRRRARRARRRDADHDDARYRAGARSEPTCWRPRSSRCSASAGATSCRPTTSACCGSCDLKPRVLKLGD